MPTDTQKNSVETQPVAASVPGMPPPEEFLSLRDILIMILRHRWAIFLIVLLATLAAGIFFITRPRSYAAEGYLQVVLPLSPEGRVDKELFETMIASHLQKVSSAYIARNVAELLNNQGIKIKPLALERQIKVARPPRTDLIRLVAGEASADKALLIVRLWIREYLASIQKNNIHAALSRTYFLLKQAQSDLMEKQATVDKMCAQVAQSSPLITLSRSVDDRQIWNDLTQKTAPDAEALKKLAAIHIKGQEQSEEYIQLKMLMLTTEQELSLALARRNLYQEVARLLEARITSNGSFLNGSTASTNAACEEAGLYVNMLMKSSEIVQFGEPGLISSARGALKKTGVAFLVSLALACFYAFMCEWGKGLLSSRS
ncbi:MAG: hypothetical protein ABIH24_06970 [Verrucomicrobiota bacterium]